MSPLLSVIVAWGVEAAVIIGAAAFPSIRESARTWWRRRPRPKGALRTVRGIARGPHRPSPFERIPCLFTWLRLEEACGGGTRKRSELAVGQDFLLHSAEGIFTVRIDGLNLVGAPAFVQGGTVVAPPDETLAEVLAPYDPSMAIVWSELHVRDGDELEVTGVCREEPALASASTGHRDIVLAPTLTGAGDRLDVRFLR